MIPNIEFGKPWRYDENFFGIIVPVLKKVSGERSYITMEEAKKLLNISDTGDIDKVKVSSKCGVPVFVRMGTMLEGEGTQSRAMTGSVVIMPSAKEVEIPVKCIHQSHGISGGSSFRVSGIAPRRVMCALASRSQSRVWNSVSRYSASMTMGTGNNVSVGYTGLDNLVETTQKIGDFKKEINDIIKSAPKAGKDQVGVVILDFEGVVGIEVFDSPKSWVAVSEDVIRKYGDTLAKKHEQPIFDLIKDRIMPKITEFLDKLKGGERRATFEVSGAKTVSIKGDKVIGEYTKISGRTIHLIGLREEHIKDTETAARTMTLSHTADRARTTNTGWTSTNHLGSGTYNVLSSIDGGRNRWKTLKRNLPISQGTLSKRLRNFEKRGLIEKRAVMSLGKPGIEYSLTSRGRIIMSNLGGIKKNLT